MALSRANEPKVQRALESQAKAEPKPKAAQKKVVTLQQVSDNRICHGVAPVLDRLALGRYWRFWYVGFELLYLCSGNCQNVPLAEII